MRPSREVGPRGSRAANYRAKTTKGTPGLGAGAEEPFGVTDSEWSEGCQRNCGGPIQPRVTRGGAPPITGGSEGEWNRRVLHRLGPASIGLGRPTNSEFLPRERPHLFRMVLCAYPPREVGEEGTPRRHLLRPVSCRAIGHHSSRQGPQVGLAGPERAARPGGDQTLKGCPMGAAREPGDLTDDQARRCAR